MSKRRLFITLLLVPLVLASGFGLMQWMAGRRPHPSRTAPTDRGALVQVVTAERAERRVLISALGTVQSARRAEIAPQVAGVVTDVAPQLATGAFFAAGELLFTVDDTDYRLALEQAKAKVIQAKSDLAILRAKAATARKEWVRRNGAEIPPPSLLILAPQIATAEAALRAARAAASQAEQNLARTRISAPFTCRILTESVEKGTYVKAGTRLLTVIAADRLEILTPVPVAELAWITVGGQEAAVADIVLRAGKRQWRWTGRVARLLAEVEPQGKTAQLVVTVDQPYRDQKDAPLLLGMLVEVTIHGGATGPVVVVPRAVLREGNVLWLVQEGRIRMQEVHVARLTRDEAWIDQGLAGGETVVATALSGVANGMKVRIANPPLAREAAE